MTSPAVQVDHLVKRYGATTAVDGLSMTVAAGSVTAVLGPNGAGKTTTIETCEGYRRPDAGTVRVLGLDPLRDARALKPRVGVMLQSGGVPSAAKAPEILRHAAALHAHPLDPRALAERLGIDAFSATSYRRLSGGQQQRLKLALAVIGRPELVFLDEPTAGLDPQARHATWDLVRELRDAGVTVVLTTHLIDEAERLADDVIVIDGGRVLTTGSPADLTKANAEEGLRFESEPGLDLASLAATLPAGSTAVEFLPGHYRVRAAMTPESLAAVTAWCASQGAMPDGLQINRRTLEDVFLELTGRELRP